MKVGAVSSCLGNRDDLSLPGAHADELGDNNNMEATKSSFVGVDFQNINTVAVTCFTNYMVTG